MATRVYIANFAGHDYTKAKEYGELHFITKGFISFQSLERVKYQVTEGIKYSDPNDWLLLSGTNIINVIASVMWMLRHETLKILNYDKNTGVYRELYLTMGDAKYLMEVIFNAPEEVD